MNNSQYWLPPQPPQQYYNPVQQTSQPYTSYQPSVNIAPNTLVGKMVNSEADVAPNEVPMDGSAGIYPARDFSAIYIKTWNKNGTISTIKFIPEMAETVSQEPNTNSVILERLDKLTSMVSKIKQYRNYNHNKKVVNDNGDA